MTLQEQFAADTDALARRINSSLQGQATGVVTAALLTLVYFIGENAPSDAERAMLTHSLRKMADDFDARSNSRSH